MSGPGGGNNSRCPSRPSTWSATNSANYSRETAEGGSSASPAFCRCFAVLWAPPTPKAKSSGYCSRCQSRPASLRPSDRSFATNVGRPHPALVKNRVGPEGEPCKTPCVRHTWRVGEPSSNSCTAAPGLQRRGTLPLVKHDIPNHDERIRLDIRCRGKYLRDHTVDLPCHLEVEMGRSHPVGSSRIRPGLDRLKPITALGIGVLNGEALEVGIKGCRIRVTRVSVAPVRIGLPQLNPRRFDWLPLHVHDPPHGIDHLARSASWLAR